MNYIILRNTILDDKIIKKSKGVAFLGKRMQRLAKGTLETPKSKVLSKDAHMTTAFRTHYAILAKTLVFGWHLRNMCFNSF